MADTAKHRNTNNSANNGRKSKNEIIRSTLGLYLKQRNYSVSLIHSKNWCVRYQCCKSKVCQNDFLLLSNLKEYGKVSQIGFGITAKQQANGIWFYVR